MINKLNEIEIRNKIELAEEQLRSEFLAIANNAFGDSVPESFKKSFVEASIKELKQNKTITSDFVEAVEEHLFEKGVLSGTAKLIDNQIGQFKMLDKEASIEVIKKLRKFHSDFINKQIKDLKELANEIEKYANYKNKILSSRYGSLGPDITEVPGLNVKTLQPYYDEMDEWYRTTNAGNKKNIGQSYRKMQEILGGHVFEHEIETLILLHEINKGGPIGTAIWLASMTRDAILDAFSDVAYNYHSDMAMDFITGD
mgnify:CR=1 FL=1